jgi:hypothetical protein
LKGVIETHAELTPSVIPQNKFSSQRDFAAEVKGLEMQKPQVARMEEEETLPFCGAFTLLF